MLSPAAPRAVTACTTPITPECRAIPMINTRSTYPCRLDHPLGAPAASKWEATTPGRRGRGPSTRAARPPVTHQKTVRPARSNGVPADMLASEPAQHHEAFADPRAGDRPHADAPSRLR